MDSQGLNDANRSLLKEILEASSLGMDPLNAKIKEVVSGEEPRYTAEFVRFLDSEMERLGKVAEAQEKQTEGGGKRGRFSKGSSVSLESMGGNADEDEDEDEDDEVDKDAPDAKSAISVLAIIKVCASQRPQARPSSQLQPQSQPSSSL